MTSCSQLDDLDAMVMGELDAVEAQAVRAHSETCSACANELAMLTAERALFARRAHALDALAPPPPMTACADAQRAISSPTTQKAPPRRLLPALGRIAVRGHFTAACAAALFVVAALSRLGTATVSMSLNDDVTSISARREERPAASGMLASYGDGEPLACSLSVLGGSSVRAVAGAVTPSGATMGDDGAATLPSSSRAPRAERLACVGAGGDAIRGSAGTGGGVTRGGAADTPSDMPSRGAVCEPSVARSALPQ